MTAARATMPVDDDYFSNLHRELGGGTFQCRFAGDPLVIWREQFSYRAYLAGISLMW